MRSDAIKLTVRVQAFVKDHLKMAVFTMAGYSDHELKQLDFHISYTGREPQMKLRVINGSGIK